VIKLPKVFVAELTYNCNHQCIFCSCPWEADKKIKDKEMSTEEWKNALERIKQYGVTQVTFTGGEPTTRKDLFEILDYAKNLGYTLGLITNGRLVDDKFLNKLKLYKILLSISVPGIETFAETTKYNNIENVLNLFKKCKELGIQTVANIAVTKKNFGELYENIALPILNGAAYVLLNRFLPGGRGLYNKQYLLTINEINEMFDIAEEVLSKAGISSHIGTELPYCIIKDPEKYKYLNIASLCAAAKSFFVIDPSGYIKVCNHSPNRICHFTEIEKIEQSEYWNKFINSDYTPQMCKDCKHLGVKCDGGCREAANVYYGGIDSQDPCFEEGLIFHCLES